MTAIRTILHAIVHAAWAHCTSAARCMQGPNLFRKAAGSWKVATVRRVTSRRTIALFSLHQHGRGRISLSIHPLPCSTSASPSSPSFDAAACERVHQRLADAWGRWPDLHQTRPDEVNCLLILIKGDATQPQGKHVAMSSQVDGNGTRAAAITGPGPGPVTSTRTVTGTGAETLYCNLASPCVLCL
jgi:hypothetical protein